MTAFLRRISWMPLWEATREVIFSAIIVLTPVWGGAGISLLFRERLHRFSMPFATT